MGSLITFNNRENRPLPVLGAGVATNSRLRGVGLAYFVPLNTFKGKSGVAVRVACICPGSEPEAFPTSGAVESAGRETGSSTRGVFESGMGGNSPPGRTEGELLEVAICSCEVVGPVPGR